MSFFNDLVTGAAAIGSICQSIGPLLTLDEETGETAAPGLSLGSITFGVENNTSCIYNVSMTDYAFIAVSNSSSGDGLTYVLPPFTQLNFAEPFDPNTLPTTKVTVSLTGTSDPNGQVKPTGSLVKLSFTGLRLGGTVNIGSFQLRCNNTGLLILSAGLTINSLAYMYLNSNRGLSATDQNTISPTSKSKQGASFPVDFTNYGFNMATDTLDGQINLGVSNPPHELVKLSKVPPEPIHPAMQKYFARRARGEL